MFGKLRRCVHQLEVTRESVAWLDLRLGDTVGEVLARLGIPDGEVSNVFRNGRLAAPGDALEPGDRLGVFPPDMSLLYC